jgi:hypothetical protein
VYLSSSSWVYLLFKRKTKRKRKKAAKRAQSHLTDFFHR